MNNNIYIILTYITLCFFIMPIKFEKTISILFIIISLLKLFIELYKRRRLCLAISVKKIDILLYTLLIFSYILAILTTEYSIKYITFTLLFFIAILYNFYNKDLEKQQDAKHFHKSCYYIMLLSILFQYIMNTQENFSMWTAWDKNYTGVILFLFFMYCNKMKYKLGIIVSIYMSIILNSRGYILMLIAFYIVKIFKKTVCKVNKLLTRNKINRIFIFIFIFTFIFSYYWVYVVASNGVKAYQEGINDTSNKMRFAANVKTYDLILNNKHLFINGYDNDIKKVLGVDSKNYMEHTVFEGVRLVQTHNSMLNIMIKVGVLFFLIYFLILSRLLEQYKDSLEYIIPYILNSIIMHSMLDGSFLLFWIFILYLKEKN